MGNRDLKVKKEAPVRDLLISQFLSDYMLSHFLRPSDVSDTSSFTDTSSRGFGIVTYGGLL